MPDNFHNEKSASQLLALCCHSCHFCRAVFAFPTLVLQVLGPTWILTYGLSEGDAEAEMLQTEQCNRCSRDPPFSDFTSKEGQRDGWSFKPGGPGTGLQTNLASCPSVHFLWPSSHLDSVSSAGL